MIVSIHQPAYIGYLAYFARIAASDLHVVLDHVSYEKNSFINRNRILGANGPQWLTVPIKTAGRMGQPIREIETASDSWPIKHWRSLEQAYSKAPYWQRNRPNLMGDFAYAAMHDFPYSNSILTSHLLKLLEIRTPRRSSCEIKACGAKSDLILNICREFGATVYLSGPLGRDYLNLEAFERAGIEVRFHDYRHPEYPQTKPGFTPNLSVLDLLFNCGPQSREILMRGNQDG